MEFGPNYNAALGVSNDSHSYYRVCPRSRQSPAVMRTCHEAREEGKLYLEERMFDKDTGLTGTSTPHRVWYNPRADTLFFGENTCISTLIHVFHSATQPIPSIAVMCSARGEQCCSHDAAVDAPGSITMLQVIHGFEQSLTSLPRRFGGCPGLEEIHFKVNSKLWPRNAGDVDSRVAFRPASGNGLTKGQIAYKRRVESEIEYVAVHGGVSGCGDSLWSGDNKPAFLFSSFAPKVVGTEDKAFGGLMLTHKNIRKLEKGQWEFVKGVERDTGCRVEVLPEEYRGEDTREIGLTGPKEAVARAKELFEKKLVRFVL
ncbi:hypothetical protein QTJ16_007133 [Diplocarpon rosae]|uniref:K Homology domain-containing protein n=1 Tax=Diplocarpon rosae TaxID=946125 RepID=A0AAD9SUZ4_9HELO|nr:hypothetical protein QTJ16_007133 [Diplocarpon rosae]